MPPPPRCSWLREMQSIPQEHAAGAAGWQMPQAHHPPSPRIPGLPRARPWRSLSLSLSHSLSNPCGARQTNATRGQRTATDQGRGGACCASDVHRAEGIPMRPPLTPQPLSTTAIRALCIQDVAPRLRGGLGISAEPLGRCVHRARALQHRGPCCGMGLQALHM